MKWRFLIIDNFGGAVRGTNDSNIAQMFALDSETYVIDLEANCFFVPDGLGATAVAIEEFKPDEPFTGEIPL
jgi:hypothetical protein